MEPIHDVLVVLLVISMGFGPQKYGFAVESCDDFEGYSKEIVMQKLVELLAVLQWLLIFIRLMRFQSYHF